MKIQHFTTKDGDTVELTDFSILVGPNNTGKSQTLLDIHDLMKNGVENTPTTIVDEIEFDPVDPDDFMRGLSISSAPNSTNRIRIGGIEPDLQSTSMHNSPQNHLDRLERQDNALDVNVVKNSLLKYKVALLDASSRLEVASETDTYDVEDDNPSDILQKLYTESTARTELRSAFKYIFEKDILLDYSSLRKFRLKISDEFDGIDENIIRPEDNPEQAHRLDDQGAGYRGLAGVILGLLLNEERIVLLDEPEAFLHPAQARRFGLWLSTHVESFPGQIIISTHNSHFLSGILSPDPDIKIHRLNRSGNRTVYHPISSDAINQLSTDPLLSSQRIIEGVFHPGAIVCEGHSDTTVYEFVSEEYLDQGGYLFTYADNKQTIPRVTKALSQSNIPTVAIVDLDIIKSPGDVREIVTSLNNNADEVNIDDLCNQFNISVREQDVDWDDLKEYGLDAVSGEESELLEEIITTAKNYGVFIVPSGELERWVDIDSSKGSGWTVNALDHLNQESPPQELLDFLDSVHHGIQQKYEDIVAVSDSGHR